MKAFGEPFLIHFPGSKLRAAANHDIRQDLLGQHESIRQKSVEVFTVEIGFVTFKILQVDRSPLADMYRKILDGVVRFWAQLVSFKPPPSILKQQL